MGNRENAQKLIKTINQKINSWNERSGFTIHGVKNLSRADLDMIKLYCQNVINYGDYRGLMKPLGSEKEVLEKAGIVVETERFMFF